MLQKLVPEWQKLCPHTLPSWRACTPLKAAHGSVHCANWGRKNGCQVLASLLRASVWPQELPGQNLIRYWVEGCNSVVMMMLTFSNDVFAKFHKISRLERWNFQGRKNLVHYWLDLLQGSSAISFLLAKQPIAVLYARIILQFWNSETQPVELRSPVQSQGIQRL
jgi:hypothetical protein